MSAQEAPAQAPTGPEHAAQEPSPAQELLALQALTFNWTSALEDVWRPSRYHVEGLHDEAAWEIRRGIGEAAVGAQRAKPLGQPLLGERGVGKTHLLD